VPEARYCLRLHHLLLLLLLLLLLSKTCRQLACCIGQGLLLLPLLLLLLLLHVLLYELLHLPVALCLLCLALLPRCLQLPGIRLLLTILARNLPYWLCQACIRICSSLCSTCCYWAFAATTLALAACSSLLSCICSSRLRFVRHAASNGYTVVRINRFVCLFWCSVIPRSSTLVC
jgi:hypothetical protein